MEFLFYSGVLPVITMSGNGLSKVYRFEKGKPTPVSSVKDRALLLIYTEQNKGSGCGKCARYKSRPFRTDVTYCKIKRLNLEAMRAQWESELN